MSIELLAHIVGFAGSAGVVLAFYQSVSGNWSPQGPLYNWINLTAGILLGLSLIVHFNLGSFVIEIFWVTISIKGLITHYRLRTQQQPDIRRQ